MSNIPSITRVRYHGPYEMNLETPFDFGLKLFKFSLLWEVVRLCFCLIADRMLRSPSNKVEADIKFTFPKQLTGAIHAVLVSIYAAVILFWCLELENVKDAYYVGDFISGEGLSLAKRDVVERTWWLFLGYLVQDTFHMVRQYPKLGKMDMMVHHVVFVVAAILAGCTQTMTLPFAWLLLGEASTPLLTMRWCIQSAAYGVKSKKVIAVARALGYSGDAIQTIEAAGKSLEYLNGVVLIVTFFVVRIVAYGFGYPHMLWVWYTGVTAEVPSLVSATLNVLVGGGGALNAYWFSIMIRKALKGPPKFKDK